MYRPCLRGKLSQRWIDNAVACIRTLDVRPGSGRGESWFTPDEATRQAFGDVTLEGLLSRVEAIAIDRCQVVALFPQQQIVSHVDAAIRGRRLHIPLVTNEGCWCFHGGEWQQLKTGQIYEMNPTIPHGSVNWSEHTRLHLMLDVVD